MDNKLKGKFGAAYGNCCYDEDDKFDHEFECVALMYLTDDELIALF